MSLDFCSFGCHLLNLRIHDFFFLLYEFEGLFLVQLYVIMFAHFDDERVDVESFSLHVEFFAHVHSSLKLF